MTKKPQGRRRWTGPLSWLGCAAIGIWSAVGLAAAGEGGADWPNWRGPYSNGSVDDWPGGVVDHPDQARLLWTSEEQDLPGSAGPRWDAGRVPPGGFSDVIVVDGRVYLNYQWPNPQGLDKEMRQWLQTNYPNAKSPFLPMPVADDIVICLDAATGKTLWKTVFAGKGVNVCYGNPNHDVQRPHNTPCYRDGRVITMGSSGRLYALEAKTGKPVWETDIGYAHLRAEQWVEYVRDGKVLAKIPQLDQGKGGGVQFPQSCLIGHSEAFDSSPTVADGVVLCHDFKTGPSGLAGMRGFDAGTGRRLWQAPECLTQMPGFPVRWVHQGKEYAVAAGSTKGSAKGAKAVCVEPRTGKVLWEIADQPSAAAPVLAENYLFLNGAGDSRMVGKKDVSGACYRITPEKAELAWKTPTGMISDGSAVVYRGWIIVPRRPDASAFRVETGEPFKLDLGPVYGPCAGDGFIFGGHSDGDAGKIYKINPDGKSFTDVSPQDAEQRKLFGHAGFLSPVYVAGRLYLRTNKCINCLDFRKESTRAKTEPMPPKATDAERWVRQLASPYFSCREEALAILIALGPDKLKAQLPSLVRLIAGEDWQGRLYATRVVKTMGESAKPASEEIKKAWLESVKKKADGDVELLSKTLVTVGPTQAGEVAATLGKLAESSEFKDVALGCRSLGELGAAGMEGVPSLARVCQSKDLERVLCAVRALGVMGSASEAAAPVLGELLQHPDQEVIFQTARTLWRMGAGAKGAFPGILKSRDYSAGAYYLPAATGAMGADFVAPTLCEELAKEVQAKTTVSRGRKKTELSDRLLYLLSSLRYCGSSAKPALLTLTTLMQTWPGTRERNELLGQETVLRILENLGRDAQAAGPELVKWCQQWRDHAPRYVTVMKKIGAEPAP